jgi:hypothetical protein
MEEIWVSIIAASVRGTMRLLSAFKPKVSDPWKCHPPSIQRDAVHSLRTSWSKTEGCHLLVTF